jgi:hypothetical protein
MQPMIGVGDTFSLTLPTRDMGVIHPSRDPKQPPYGLAFVFFAACAGTLKQVTPTEDSPLPIACTDANGAFLGADDFVAGYTQIYVFDDYTNANPVLADANGKGHMTFRGQTFEADCINGACVGLADPVEDPCITDPNGVRCVPTCADDGDIQKCTKHDFQPALDPSLPANHEPDSIAALAYGRAYGEEMWIDYYADRGNFDPPLKLFSDAQSGFNPKYASHFLAPKDPGPVRVWVVLHDNRGGVAWEGFTLGAK